MKYTAVFEFEEAQKIKKDDSWLGGKLCVVAFDDIVEEFDKLQEKIELIKHWRDEEGNIEELDKILCN